jgi:uncharacterized Zn finger protein (UPF0148 family)
MGEVKPFTVRSCPVCRVAMVRSDSGWHCPQCGSVIVDVPPKAEAPERARGDNAPISDVRFAPARA